KIKYTTNSSQEIILRIGGQKPDGSRGWDMLFPDADQAEAEVEALLTLPHVTSARIVNACAPFTGAVYTPHKKGYDHLLFKGNIVEPTDWLALLGPVDYSLAHPNKA